MTRTEEPTTERGTGGTNGESGVRKGTVVTVGRPTVVGSETGATIPGIGTGSPRNLGADTMTGTTGFDP